MFMLTAATYTELMLETRLAAAADAELIGQQPNMMFIDAGHADEALAQKVFAKFVLWGASNEMCFWCGKQMWRRLGIPPHLL